jgi:choline dehydrogenase-like flavoprotein
VKVDLQGVGQNLQDHVGTYVGLFTINQPLAFKIERDISPATLLEYLTEGTGPLTSAGVYSGGFVSSKYEIENARKEKRKAWPDLQLSIIGHSIPQNFSIIANEENIKIEVLEGLWGSQRDKDSFQIFVFPTRPVGRGEVLLADRNPDTPPLIDPKYLGRLEDVKVTVEGNPRVLEVHLKVAFIFTQKIHLAGQLGARQESQQRIMARPSISTSLVSI